MKRLQCTLIFLSAMLPVVLLIGCTPQAKTTQFKYDYTSPAEEALLAVQKSPFKFLVPYGEERYAWERVGIFFKDMVKSNTPVVNTNTASGEILASTGNSKNYLYTI